MSIEAGPDHENPGAVDVRRCGPHRGAMTTDPPRDPVDGPWSNSQSVMVNCGLVIRDHDFGVPDIWLTLQQGTNVIAYDSSDLVAATNNFSLANKIGHGGFGNVYKMKRGMNSFCFFNIKVGTTYYLAYNCWGSISNEDKGASHLAGTTNNFSLANKIGDGGFGNVYKGTDVIACDSNDLAVATNNFSLANKIGHSGFGNVYKDFTDFENEVKLIAKLRHRNLNKLLGYCINGAEKFLVYEFMAKSSLDKVIFGITSYYCLCCFDIEKPQKTEI
ncbi:hypothetical protein H5410_016138 [Solanum commersonii]|uniref:Protein kinase domain-containing protein n=1 Tax=Solanum commersonii TaxID=4109 RepID=A0A9J5ZWI0_SOLCO|nr:hypothetical protein H5410_016138 [Solanum commersonii]